MNEGRNSENTKYSEDVNLNKEFKKKHSFKKEKYLGLVRLLQQDLEFVNWKKKILLKKYIYFKNIFQVFSRIIIFKYHKAFVHSVCTLKYLS